MDRRMSRIKNPLPKKMDLHCRSGYAPTFARCYHFAPGNMTGYELAVARLSEDEVLIAWLWRGSGVGGAAMAFDFRDHYDVEYVAMKMDIEEADALAICQFARYLHPRFTFEAPEAYRVPAPA